MQHPIDEFSVSDLRQTLGQVGRIVSVRRWWFVFPFGLATIAALLASLALPRSFSSRTVFERRRDAVLANMGRGWADSLEAVRATMVEDLQRPDLWVQAWRSLGPVATSSSSSTTPAIASVAVQSSNGAAAQIPATSVVAKSDVATTQNAIAAAPMRFTRADLAAAMTGLTVKSSSADPSRDIVTVELTGRDPTYFPALLRAARSRYIASARERTERILTDARRFYERQTQNAATVLKQAQDDLKELETSYPGVSPTSATRINAEIAQLTEERNELMRKSSTLKSQMELHRARISQLAAAEVGPPPPPAIQPQQWVANPAYAQLKAELERLRKDLWESRTTKGMTEQHPAVIAMSDKITRLEGQLIGTTPTITVDAGPLPEPAPAAQGAALFSEQARLQAELDAMAHDRVDAGERQAVLQVRLDELASQQETATEHAGDYNGVRERIEKAQAEVDSWQANIEPLDRVLKVQNGDRGIRFSTIEEPAVAGKPITPNVRNVLLACFVAGLAFGVGCMLAAEFGDRSFRSVSQLGNTLGIPILEGIDIIRTNEERRRMRTRRIVLMPLLTGLLMAALVFAVGMTYRYFTMPADAHWWSDLARLVS